MSFISDDRVVEDGSGLINANSYISALDAKKYLNLQNRTTLAALSDDILYAYLVQGTLYIDKNFNFKGAKKNDNQALQFPRAGESSVPDDVKIATIEAAALEQKGALYYDSGEKDTHVIEEKVGPITTKYSESSDSQRETQIDRAEYIESLLRDFIDYSVALPISNSRGD